MATPVSTLVIYRPRQGREKDLRDLVEQHGPVLAKSGLITSTPVRSWKATDKQSGAPFFVEMFEWKDEEASGIAHQTPEVMSVWEPMELVLEDLQIARLEPLAGDG